MNVIGTELSELSAHYLKKKKKKKLVTFDFVYILSAYIDQSEPNLGNIYLCPTEFE